MQAIESAFKVYLVSRPKAADSNESALQWGAPDTVGANESAAPFARNMNASASV